ncbi:MAG: glycosyltransferase family 4 protein [Chloroflexota bacterium]
MPLRVLHVLEATIGGTKRHLLDLAPGLRDRGVHVEIACPRVRDQHHGDTSFWDDAQSLGIPTHQVPMTRRPFTAANARAIGRLASLIRDGRYHVVHAQSSIAGALARPAALISGRRPKIVYSPHGYAFLSEEWGRRRAAFLAAERALSAITDRVIAVSAAEGDEAIARRVVSHKRLAVIPNGVASSTFPAERLPIERLVPQLAHWAGVPLVGTIARMTPQKDPLTWLRVAARVRSAHRDARFVWIWGGGALEQDVYDETDRLGLRQYFAFLGHRADARQLLGALNVFLLTSRFEGLPYSAIEALSMRTAIVATDVPGTRDVVRHNETGLLAPSGDVTALADAVTSLLSDPQLAGRLGDTGRADALARFSIERMVGETAALYQGLGG